MKRMLSLGAVLLTLGAVSILPTLAQDKMGAGKMGGKMAAGKMSGDTMMSKATMDLSDAQKQYVMMKMSKMSATDKLAMEKKMAGYSPSVRKGQVTKMMNKDKMGGGKMAADKMGSGKMDKGGKM